MDVRAKIAGLVGALAISAAGGAALAQQAPGAAELSVAGPPRAPGRWFAHANLGINAFTYLAATGSQNSRWVTPADKVILLQQLGAGYWVHPNVRLQLTLQFVETLTGTGPNESAYTLFGFIPWVVFTHGRFFAGTGVLLAPWSGGRDAFDVGIFNAVGVTFPLGEGWALAAAAQVPVMLGQRVSVAVSPALVVSRRF